MPCTTSLLRRPLLAPPSTRCILTLQNVRFVVDVDVDVNVDVAVVVMFVLTHLPNAAGNNTRSFFCLFLIGVSLFHGPPSYLMCHTLLFV
jgi:hypothetical protein